MKYILLLCSFAFCASLLAQTNETIRLDHDGIQREFELHLPPGHTSSGQYPLVINMHGLGSDRAQQKFYSQMDRVADTASFMVAYPQGVEVLFQGVNQRHWNAGFGTGVDDLGFLIKLIDKVAAEYGLDQDRVYCTGMSNGGYMSYYFACNHADRVTAIASVTGSMTSQVLNSCDPSGIVPAMQIHGTADGVVGFNGPPKIDDVVDFWLDNNNCDATPVEEMIPDIDMGDNCTAIKKTYSGCDEDSEVWYYVIDNGGHTWPGSFEVPQLGNTCGDFFATTEVWEFFKQFPKTSVNTQEVDRSPLNVFPNPSSDFVKIEGALTSRLEVFNIEGRKFIIDGSGPGVFNVEHLSSGLYHGQWNNRSFSLIKK